ncbi:cytochrome P450 [Xylariaceae sp. FL0662B]|nr:cytochrome P450 [Xylariaceae sp. FL0662B]
MGIEGAWGNISRMSQNIYSQLQSPILLVALTGIVSLYLLYLTCYMLYNLFLHPLAKFPGPWFHAATPIPYVLAQIQGRLPLMFGPLHAKYGDVVRVHPNELSFNCEEAWRDIYSLRPGRPPITKVPGLTAPSHEGVYNIVTTTDVTDHKRYRATLNPAFSERSLRNQEPIVMKYVSLLFEKLRQHVAEQPEQRQDFINWLNWMSFDLIGDLTFGDSLNGLSEERSHPWMANMFDSFRFNLFSRAANQLPHLAPMLRYWLIPSEMAEQRKQHATFTGDKVDQRMAMDTERQDFMSCVLPYDEKRTRMNLAEIRNTYGTLMIAGSETTATTMAFTVWWLCKNPESMHKLNEEIRSQFSTESEITISSTTSLKYMNAVLNESMRIQPAAPASQPRWVPKEGEVIAGRHVPGQTVVAIPPVCMYHDARYFKDPLKFVPERWLDDEKYRSDNRAIFQPFSVGPRSCIGRTLAMNEMRVVLARLIWNFDLELTPASDHWAEELKIYVLWEKTPFWVKMKLREQL